MKPGIERDTVVIINSLPTTKALHAPILSHWLTQGAKEEEENKHQQMRRWQGVEGNWQLLHSDSVLSVLLVWRDNQKTTVRVLVRRGVSSAPFVLTRPSLQGQDEQIRCRGLPGICSNLLCPPGWGWLWRSAAPKPSVTGGCDHSPRLQKNCNLWLSCSCNRWASSQF